MTPHEREVVRLEQMVERRAAKLADAKRKLKAAKARVAYSPAGSDSVLPTPTLGKLAR